MTIGSATHRHALRADRELRPGGARPASPHVRRGNSEMLGEAVCRQASHSPEERQAISCIHQPERWVSWRIAWTLAYSAESLYGGQVGVTMGDRMPKLQPLVDSSVSVGRSPGEHPTAPAPVLRPCPERARVESSGLQKLPRVLGVRRTEVANLRPHTARKEAVGRSRHRIVRTWGAQFNARQRQVLDDGLPRRHRENNDCPVDCCFLIPSPSP